MVNISHKNATDFKANTGTAAKKWVTTSYEYGGFKDVLAAAILTQISSQEFTKVAEKSTKFTCLRLNHRREIGKNELSFW